MSQYAIVIEGDGSTDYSVNAPDLPAWSRPEATRVCSGPARPKISASFQIVVDWPQG